MPVLDPATVTISVTCAAIGGTGTITLSAPVDWTNGTVVNGVASAEVGGDNEITFGGSVAGGIMTASFPTLRDGIYAITLLDFTSGAGVVYYQRSVATTCGLSACFRELNRRANADGGTPGDAWQEARSALDTIPACVATADYTTARALLVLAQGFCDENGCCC